MDGHGARLINLAFRVADVAQTEDGVARTAGWSKRAVHEIDGERFLEAAFGDVRINFFRSALYDDADAADAPGFLHASFAVPDLGAVLDDPVWRARLVWGPGVIRGGFGHRRIAFFEPFPGCRIELMEEIHDRA
ncbi:hypothetical protein [Labrys wisconsinensis]|uniref:VOC domain-containing protein n=1 Tax=Labrys wisconsinensis TaxID=425677 RepID=A0ABU0JJX8_9HYPH|nr:hypothetical protein [Labrys wisconsinensis]MDQ0474596.1 hypothetical protein [Labrys wisconsinensis]